MQTFGDMPCKTSSHCLLQQVLFRYKRKTAAHSESQRMTGLKSGRTSKGRLPARRPAIRRTIAWDRFQSKAGDDCGRVPIPSVDRDPCGAAKREQVARNQLQKAIARMA